MGWPFITIDIHNTTWPGTEQAIHVVVVYCFYKAQFLLGKEGPCFARLGLTRQWKGLKCREQLGFQSRDRLQSYYCRQSGEIKICKHWGVWRRTQSNLVRVCVFVDLSTCDNASACSISCKELQTPDFYQLPPLCACMPRSTLSRKQLYLRANTPKTHLWMSVKQPTYSIPTAQMTVRVLTESENPQKVISWK